MNIVYHHFKFFVDHRRVNDSSLNLLAFCENLCLCPIEITNHLSEFKTEMSYLKGADQDMVFRVTAVRLGRENQEVLLEAFEKAKTAVFLDVKVNTHASDSYFGEPLLPVEFYFENEYKVTVHLNKSLNLHARFVDNGIIPSCPRPTDTISFVGMLHKNIKKFFEEIDLMSMVKAGIAVDILSDARLARFLN